MATIPRPRAATPPRRLPPGWGGRGGGAGRDQLALHAHRGAHDPAGVPDVVANQVRQADAVRVVAPVLTGRLQSWVSDVDAEYREADERMRMLVSGINASGPAVSGEVGDGDPLLAVADALVEFPADALILGVHASNDANWRERRFSQRVRARFGLPVTEVMLDRDGQVLSVSAE